VANALPLLIILNVFPSSRVGNLKVTIKVVKGHFIYNFNEVP